MKLALVGPIQVHALRPWLDLTEQESELPEGLGGTPVTQLALGLLQAGHELAIVSLDNSLAEELRLCGPQLRLFLGPNRPQGRARDFYRAERHYITDAVRRSDADVAHAHWTYEYALGALASGVPTLITVRDWAPRILRQQLTPFRALRLLMNVATLVKGRHFTVTSPYMKRRLEQWLRRDVPLIANAIGDHLFLPSAREQPPEGPPCIIAINNGWSKRKNVPVLLQAFATVRETLPDCRLRLIGNDHEPGGSAQRWAHDHGLEEGVEFYGAVPNSEIAGLLDQATVFAHPALEESFGLVLVEAMARGVPVIGGRRTGAVPWVLDHGRAGILIDATSSAELANALLHLLNSVEDRQRLAHAGLEHARANFRVGAVFDRYVEQYEAIRR